MLYQEVLVDYYYYYYFQNLYPTFLPFKTNQTKSRRLGLMVAINMVPPCLDKVDL